MYSQLEEMLTDMRTDQVHRLRLEGQSRRRRHSLLAPFFPTPLTMYLVTLLLHLILGRYVRCPSHQDGQEATSSGSQRPP